MTSGLEALRACVTNLGSQRAVAEAVGVTQQAVSEALRNGKRVPAEWVLALERATQGAVTRYELRPDLYPLNDTPPPTPPAAAAQRVA